ncbi:MAG: AMP-binding protein, partial [Hyphomicrobiales bacterium]|nr:AMP-binding protein [Hyphomicrobiales bacterium]
MTSNHLFSFIREAATLHERPFLETPQGRKLDYGDVLAGSARFAHALAALGVVPGDRVAVQVEKSPEALLLYLGCVRAGAVFLPLNTAYTTAELEYFIGDAEPSLIVGDPAKH